MTRIAVDLSYANNTKAWKNLSEETAAATELSLSFMSFNNT